MRWVATPLAPIALAFGLGIAGPPWTQGAPAWAAWASGLGGAAVLLVLGRLTGAAL